MRITVIVDNNAQGELEPEWGFSALVELSGETLLLDAGGGATFAENARKLGVDLGSVDAAVLSHAHFDHSDGMPDFFAANDHAPLYLQECCAENCYCEKPEGLEYIGIEKGLLAEYESRLKRVSGVVSITENAALVSHSAPNMAEVGKAEGMFTKVDGELVPENFEHEQSLVVDTPDGLCVFNSCSHAGIDIILQECAAVFPGRPISAYVGGLHLFNKSDEYVLALAERIARLGVKSILTGHCTGERALELFQEKLGPAVQQFSAGKVFEL